MGFFRQFVTLFWKHLLIAVRNWKGSIFQLISPLLVVLLLLGFQKISDFVLDRVDDHPIPTPIGSLPHCTPRNELPCNTMIYAPKNVEWVERVMKTLAERNDLDFNSTFKALESDSFNLTGDYATLYNYIINNQNTTQHAILWLSPYLDPFFARGREIPGELGYILFYNSTKEQSYTDQAIRSLDETLLSLRTNWTNVTIDIATKPFPRKFRISGYDVVAANGGTWFFLPPMIIFFHILTELVYEKEMRLRLGMKMMGLKTSVYWSVWFTMSLVFVTLSTLILISSGVLCGFSFFLNSSFAAVFLLFFLFGVAMVCLAFCLSTLIATTKSAQTVGYAIILVGFVFQAIMSSGNGLLVDMLWTRDLPQWVIFVRIVLTQYPPFNFDKTFSDIAYRSSDILSLTEGRIVKGAGFSWDDLFISRQITFYTLNINIPAPIEQITWLAINAAVYGVLALYLDNVLPGEHGSPKHPLFFLDPRYWGLLKRRASKYHTTEIVQQNLLEHEEYDSDVEQEIQRAFTCSNDSVAVRICNLTKIYRKYPCCSSRQDVKAVDNVSLVIEDGEIFCLLGHNGAGKTTIINIMTGLFHPTFGFATIYGYDVVSQIEEIQKIMGVCPQQNILWDELTAREHLVFFAVLKGISPLRIAQEVNAKLTQSGLMRVSNERVSTFSGGMKRRLSVAISSIGEPRIIFMDEPTTGLDPVHKREVWHLIENMKKNRVIILTTHSMEEADILGSRIGILVNGKLRCLGNSLRLKSRYGEGYKISFIIKDPHRAEILIKEMLEEWTWLRSNFSGSLSQGTFVVRITRERFNFIPDLVQFLEVSPDVSEWGLSHSTLEEVFLNITNKYTKTPHHSQEQSSFNKQIKLLSDKQTESIDSQTPPSVTNKEGLILSSKEELPSQNMQIDIHSDSVSIDMSQSTTQTSTEKSSHLESRPKSHDVKKLPTSYPFRALFRKNFSLQKRQTFTNVCQIITPVLTMAILVLLQLIIRSQLGNGFENRQLVQTVPFPLNEPGLHFPFRSHDESSIKSLLDSITSTDPISFIQQFQMINEQIKVHHSISQHFTSLDRRERIATSMSSNQPETPPSIDQLQFISENVTRNTTSDCLIFFLYSDNEANVSVGTLLENGTAEGLLGEIPQFNCTLYNDTVIFVPYYSRRESLTEIEDEILSDIIIYNNESLSQVNTPPYAYLLPDGFVSFQYVNYTQFQLTYTFGVNTNVIVNYHRPNNFTRLDIKLPNFLNSSLLNDTNTIDLRRRLLIINEGRFQLQSMINRAFASYTMKLHNISEGRILSPFLNIRFVQRMPYFATADLLAILEAFGTILYPVALSLQLPIYIYLLVLEKSQKLKSMMQQHGMKSWHYVLTNYTFFLMLYSLVVGFFWISGIAVQIRFFVQTHPLLLFLFFFGWGNCLITIAFFISSFLNSPRASSIVGYAISLLGTLIAEVVCIGIYGPFAFSLGTELPKWLFIWPQFSFVRGMYLMNDACAEKYACYGPPWTLPLDSEFLLSLFSLYLAPIVYFVIFLYLDQVLPSEYGVAKHPLFCFIHTSERLSRQELKGKNSQTKNKTNVSEMEQQTLLPAELSEESLTQKISLIRTNANVNIQETVQSEDPDVIRERERVVRGDYSPNAPLVICDLYKEYPRKPRPKVALNKLTLIVEEGECFGLLGENGAGKTTTISILTGLIPPTSGWATVAGYDIRTQMNMVQLMIGVCPQFDCQWNELTVLEHILFYARLKGVPPSKEMTHAKEILSQVGLWNVANRLSRDLSGGMKRRLSIAISFVGDSKIVFLDEPTTGLDPASRRQIWDIIIQARKNRAIFLTTHSMEEAEILCTRIGILAHGVLCCLGSQQHLKNAFGEGYRLKINFAPEDEEKARNFILTSFPSATILASFKGTEEYQLEKGTKISEVFTLMEERRHEFGILDWSITQVGLLDVFQKIVAATHQYEDETENDSYI